MISNQVWINYGNLHRKQLNPLVGNIAIPFRQGKDVMSRSAGTFAESPLVGAVNYVRLKKPKMDKIIATSVGFSGASVEAVSYTHLDVYKRQFMNSMEDAPLRIHFSKVE